MWVPKWKRDQAKGVDSPVPTQEVSNEEFIPRPQNELYRNYGEVEEAETLEPAATEEKWPKGEYFIIDVQAHFTNGLALQFRKDEFMKNMGFNLKNDIEAYSFQNFVKEMFYDSETSVVVISGVPTLEKQRDPE